MNKIKHYVGLLKNFKPADKPHKKKKNWTPPGNGGRKVAQLVIWAWVGFVTLIMVGTILQNRANNQMEAMETTTEVNAATQTAAVEFAKQFAATYFTWEASPEGFKTRKELLAPMLAKGLDEQAGLITGTQDWNSATTGAQVVAVNQTGEQKALITMKVEQVLSKEVDEKKQTETVEHLFTVPVGFADAYGVYDLPNFSAFAEQNNLEAEYLKGDGVDAEVQANIKAFLNTFFQSYTTDTPDKLAYFLDDPKAKGLNGSKELVEVKAATVVQDGKDYIVETNVVLSEPTSGVQYAANYKLRIEQEGTKYMVTKLNEGAE